jgi:hypothetical protein
LFSGGGWPFHQGPDLDSILRSVDRVLTSIWGFQGRNPAFLALAEIQTDPNVYHFVQSVLRWDARHRLRCGEIRAHPLVATCTLCLSLRQCTTSSNVHMQSLWERRFRPLLLLRQPLACQHINPLQDRLYRLRQLNRSGSRADSARRWKRLNVPDPTCWRTPSMCPAIR